MYAIVRTGGKQYRVREGEVLRVEKLEVEPGSTVTLDDVLAVGEGASLNIGTPMLESAAVTAEVVGHGRGKKIRVYKIKVALGSPFADDCKAAQCVQRTRPDTPNQDRQ